MARIVITTSLARCWYNLVHLNCVLDDFVKGIESLMEEQRYFNGVLLAKVCDISYFKPIKIALKSSYEKLGLSKIQHILKIIKYLTTSKVTLNYNVHIIKNYSSLTFFDVLAFSNI